MTGEQLHKIIKRSNVNVEDLILKSGIGRRTFFNLYKKATVPDNYLDDIIDSGFDIYDWAKKFSIDVILPNKVVSAKKNTDDTDFEYMKKYISLLEKQNKDWEKKYEQAIYSRETLLAQLERLTNKVDGLNFDELKDFIIYTIENNLLKKK